MKSVWEHFHQYVLKLDCSHWIWVGGEISTGYGCLSVNKKSALAHITSWELHRGPIPEGLYTLHKCDIPLCVNPEHLFLGTQKDNIRDLVEKGRHPGSLKTHCKRGHEFTPENTKITTYGSRSCKTCLDKLYASYRKGGAKDRTDYKREHRARKRV